MIKLRQSKDGKFYFTVTAKNGKVLVTSETYNTRRSLKIGYSALVKALNGVALIKDLTKK